MIRKQVSEEIKDMCVGGERKSEEETREDERQKI